MILGGKDSMHPQNLDLLVQWLKKNKHIPTKWWWKMVMNPIGDRIRKKNTLKLTKVYTPRSLTARPWKQWWDWKTIISRWDVKIWGGFIWKSSTHKTFAKVPQSAKSDRAPGEWQKTFGALDVSIHN